MQSYLAMESSEAKSLSREKMCSFLLADKSFWLLLEIS